MPPSSLCDLSASAIILDLWGKPEANPKAAVAGKTVDDNDIASAQQSLLAPFVLSLDVAACPLVFVKAHVSAEKHGQLAGKAVRLLPLPGPGRGRLGAEDSVDHGNAMAA